MDVIIVIGNLVTIGAAAGVAYLYGNSGKLIYKGTRLVKQDPSVKDWDFHEAYVETSEGKTHLWFIPAADETDRTILFSHGNAGNLGDKLDSIGIFRGLGFNVLAYDYGGYGQSGGTTHEARMVEDIVAVWEYAVNELNIPPDQMIVHGRSMGGGPTAHLATRVSAGAVVLESTFCSLTELITARYRYLPKWLFGRNRFDTLSRIGDIDSPVLIIHSEEDSTIPYEQGERLYDAASDSKAFLKISGEHHEGFWKHPETYNQGLLDFINTHVPENKDRV